MMGIPGAGKTYLRKKMCEEDETLRVISPDEIRLALGMSEYDRSRNEEVFRAAHAIARQNLRNGHSVLVDATSTSSARLDWQATANTGSARTRLLVVPVQWSLAQERNSLRAGGRVATQDMVKFINQFTYSLCTIWAEGWNEISFADINAGLKV
jgi:predicted kinase